MAQSFFDAPILNTPYTAPDRHWELDKDGRPTDPILGRRRKSDLISAMPGAKAKGGKQACLTFNDLSTEDVDYKPAPYINEFRDADETWRNLRNPTQWRVSPVTQRLLQHWHAIQADETVPIRPFSCQLEAVEVAIWLAEVAPKDGKRGKRFLEWLKALNEAANPDLFRIALKLATSVGNTTLGRC